MAQVDPEQAVATFSRADTGELLAAASDLKFKPEPGDVFVIDDQPWVVDSVRAVLRTRGGLIGMTWFRYDVLVRPDLR